MKKTVLTEKDYNVFYKAMLYRKIDDPIDSAIKAAYRDMCRTIRGFSKNTKHDEILRNCKEKIYSEIKNILKYNNMTQEHFDMWHKMTCESLICFSKDILTYGQAQKWINMTLKYISMFDHKIVESIYEYCHVPIDKYILDATKYEQFDTAWSKLNDYNEYFKFQKWFRKKYDGIPLDEEFKMWLEEGRNIIT